MLLIFPDLLAAVLVDEAWNLRNGVEQPLKSIFDGIFVALELLRVGPAHELMHLLLRCDLDHLYKLCG